MTTTRKENKNYGANQIRVLEGLEAVRLRPGMYIGSTGPKGLAHLVWEILDNSVDEHLAGYCSEIIVSLNADGSVTITDNGRGIPVEIHPKTGKSTLETVLTVLHAGGKFGDGGYTVSGGLHGVGVSVVNALSNKLIAEVYKDGKIYRQEYEKGEPKTELLVVGDTKKSGTSIKFYPDDTIFETVEFKSEVIKNRLFEQVCLNKGLKISFIDEKSGENNEFYEEEGIKALLRNINENKKVLGDIFYLKGYTPNAKDKSIETKTGVEVVEVAFQYIDDFVPDDISGYCNNIATIEGGTHVTGLKTALGKLVNIYVEELNLNKKDKLETRDILNGFTAVINVRHFNPQFEGQTKTKLGNTDARSAVSDIFFEEGRFIFDKDIPSITKIIELAISAQNKRKKDSKNKLNLNSKEIQANVNKKLAHCNSEDPTKTEVFLVEGDSAGGTTKQGRDRETQAVLPLRGKILNIEKSSWEKVTESDVLTMFATFGCGYGEDFDITKLKYHKIIILTDADVDGAHIRTLLLTLFYRYAPELILQGHVYIGVSPLYKVTYTKNRKEVFVYAYSDKELNKLKSEIKNIKSVQRYKGLGEMSAEQLWDTTLNPHTRNLQRVTISDKIEIDKTVNLLMGSKVAPRKEFIRKESKRANVDI